MVRSKLPWILFAGSLLLNLFFAGGVIYSKMVAERLRQGPEARLDFVVDELGLSPEERERLLALRAAAREGRDEMRREGQPLRRALMEEMSKESLDEARVNELLSQRSKLFVDYLGGMMSETHDFLDQLEPEKRQEFLAMMEREQRFLWRLLREPRGERPSGP